MRRKFWILVILLSVGGLWVSSAPAQTSHEPAPPSVGAEAKSVARAISSYRVEYSVYEVEAGKRNNTRKFVVLVTDDGREAGLKAGSRVPVTTGTVTEKDYVFVGIDLYPRLRLRDEGLYLTTSFHMSSVAEERYGGGPLGAPVIRSLEARDAANVVLLGKPMLVTSVDDVVGNRRYELEAVVTKQ